MHLSNMVFAVLGTLWLAFSAITNTLKEINEKRDCIISRRINNEEITKEHQKLIYDSDWKPLYVIFLLLTSAFGIIFIKLPNFFTQPNSDLNLICWIFSGISWFAFICFFICGYKDMREIRRVLGREVEKKKKKRSIARRT